MPFLSWCGKVKMFDVQNIYNSPSAPRKRGRPKRVKLLDLRGPREVSDPSNIQLKRSATGTVKAETANSNFYSKFGIVPMNDSTDSLDNSTTGVSIRMKKMTRIYDGTTKFPKLEECAHFHYDFVELGPVQVYINDDNQENLYKPGDDLSEQQFYISVNSNERCWTIRRSYDNFRGFDKQLHRCIFDRKYSLLPELRKNEVKDEGAQALKKLLSLYLHRFSSIAGNMMNCGPILSWLEMDNRGNRLIVTDDSAINTPAVAAGHVIKRYNAQAPDEISFQVGDIISLIDMPPTEESAWWRGKKGFEVGFFPADCVEVIGDKIPSSMASQIPETPAKPVLRKRGKLISFLRAFFNHRPARAQLKRSGIVKERVFGCDLGEHLLNSAQDVPLVLKCCADVIETHGIQDGIYRLSGVASNIQKLRNDFDEDTVPDLTSETYLQDIHSISSLLKMYFRELPNPLFTYQLYDKFAGAIQDEENRLVKIHDVVQQLPPPHYRTAEYLMKHLNRIAQHGRKTGMHCKNLAIVWAPNLLRSKELETSCTTAALQGVGIQAIVTEFMIGYADLIFSDSLHSLNGNATGSLRRGRPKSLAISTPTKLLSLEEARERALSASSASPKQKYIEVGGGPSNLPEKYHTVIDVKKNKTRKGGKSPVSGWRAIFNRSSKSQSFRKDSDTSLDYRSRLSSDTSPVHGIGEYGEYEVLTEEDVARRRQLRSVRSADSLLSGTSATTHSHNTTHGATHGADDEYQRVRPKSATLDRVEGTKRSISCDNSYSGSDVEVFPDQEEDYERNTRSLDTRSKKGKGKGKNKSELVSELETRISTRGSKSPKGKKGKSSKGKTRSTSSSEMEVSPPVVHTTIPGLMAPPSPPGVPKRSRSMGYDQNEALPCFSTDPSLSSQENLIEPIVHETYEAVPPSQRDPFSSFGKKKKKKKPPAPVPPTVPPTYSSPSASPEHATTNAQHTANTTHPPILPRGDAALSQSAPNVSHVSQRTGAMTLDLEPSYSSSELPLSGVSGSRDPLSPIGEVTPVGEMTPVVPLELSESPGARRKFYPQGEYQEMEEAGVEGAPGEMAAYFTDEEVFQQNLSLTTDSDADVADQRESMSQLDLSVSLPLSLSSGGEGVPSRSPTQEPPARSPPGQAPHTPYIQDRGTALSSEEQSEGEALATADVTAADRLHRMSASRSMGVLSHKLSSPDDPHQYYDTLQSERSTDMDLASEMSKSLDSLLRTAAGSDVYMTSCDDDSDRRHGGGDTSTTDTGTDVITNDVMTNDDVSMTSGARYTSSTSVNDSDIPGAEVYAETLSPTPQSAGYIHRRTDPLPTTDTDSCPGEGYPRDGYRGERVSDTDTEIALLSDTDRDGVGGANIPIGYSSTDIDLSETDVAYIDPHADADVAMAASEVAKELNLVTTSITENVLCSPPEELSTSGSAEETVDVTAREPRSESEVIVNRKPGAQSPEGRPQLPAKVKVTTPTRHSAKAPAPPPPVKQDSGIASGDSLGEGEGLTTSYGDGYLADRSSSASPTFTESRGKMVRRHTRVAGEVASVSVSEGSMEPLKEQPEHTSELKSPEVRSPVKEVKRPADLVRPPVKEVRSPVKGVRSPVNEVRSPLEEKRGSTDSGLIFEMDDIHHDNFKKSESQDRLNMSCDSDDIFREDATGNDLSRSESKMATSSSPDIPTTGISMATSDEMLDSVSDVTMATPPSPPAMEPRSDLVVRAGHAGKERKNTPQRKKSVKELLSKFETANSPPSAGTSDTSSQEAARVRPVYQRPRVVKARTSPTDPESDVTPFYDSENSVDSRMSTSAPAGKVFSPTVELKNIVIETRPEAFETVPKPTLSATSPKLSTSPKVTDRIKCFETSSSVGDSTDSDTPRARFSPKPKPSPDPPAQASPSVPPAPEQKKTASRHDTTSESESEAKRAASRPGRASRNRVKDIENMPTLTLAERMKCFQESGSAGSTSAWGRSSSERESLSPLHISESDSSTAVESVDKSPSVETKPLVTTATETKPEADPVRLSDRRRLFEKSGKSEVHESAASRSTKSEPEEVTTTTTPASRGTFQRKVAKSEPKPAAESADTGVSDGDKFGSLSERRKRFESFKREEGERPDVRSPPAKQTNNNQKPGEKGAKSAEASPDNTLSQRVKTYGAKTVVIEGSKESDQSEKVVDNAATCNPTSANKENIQNNNERPISVRDLSRQFERQQTPSGDPGQGNVRLMT